jgi:hypothetical protein
MSGTEGRPARRPRHAVPRVQELDALLREVDELRLTLETDLTLAAAALEADATKMAIEIIDSDRRSVAGFESRALGHLAAIPHHSRSWVPAHAGPLLAAAALVGLFASVVPQVTGTTTAPRTSTVAATDSLERLQELVNSGDTSQVRAASEQLHQQLSGVVARAKSDPLAAQNALLLLSYEQTALAGSIDSGALADVLQQSRALATIIRAALPGSVPSPVLVAPVANNPQPAPASSPKPSASPKPSPKPSPTTKASTKPSTSPSGSGSPSPGSSSGPELPRPPLPP